MAFNIENLKIWKSRKSLKREAEAKNSNSHLHEIKVKETTGDVISGLGHLLAAEIVIRRNGIKRNGETKTTLAVLWVILR